VPNGDEGFREAGTVVRYFGDTTSSFEACMHLILLPGMDGTGQLFGPLLRVFPPGLVATVVAYPPDMPCGYAELLSLAVAAVPDGGEFLVLGESFSGPLAILLAARQPPGLRGVILCASFVRSPLPAFARWLRGLIRPFWFRALPWPLLRRGLLGRFDTASLTQMVETAIIGVQPAVLAARARAVLAVDVGVQLQSCPVPILYLAATEDRLVSQKSLAHIKRLQPRVVAVALVGPHLLLQVAPKEAAEAIQTFAASCQSPNQGCR
jgi:pimeloyl-[acyl-carrier protein] methyl ester esterase